MTNAFSMPQNFEELHEYLNLCYRELAAGVEPGEQDRDNLAHLHNSLCSYEPQNEEEHLMVLRYEPQVASVLQQVCERLEAAAAQPRTMVQRVMQQSAGVGLHQVAAEPVVEELASHAAQVQFNQLQDGFMRALQADMMHIMSEKSLNYAQYFRNIVQARCQPLVEPMAVSVTQAHLGGAPQGAPSHVEEPVAEQYVAPQRAERAVASAERVHELSLSGRVRELLELVQSRETAHRMMAEFKEKLSALKAVRGAEDFVSEVETRMEQCKGALGRFAPARARDMLKQELPVLARAVTRG